MKGDFRIADWLVEPTLNRISQNGTGRHLEPKIMEVLVCLAGAENAVVAKQKLIDEVWKGTFVTDDVLTRAISELRDAFGDHARDPQIIQTIPKQGYRLLPPVASASHQPLSGKRRFVQFVLLAFAISALLGVAFFVTRSRAREATAHKITSLAVLPIRNLSGDSSQEYLADGMTEELIGRLSRIHDLRVISRTSVMRFKDTKLSVPEIASSLGVDALVEGSVIREGGRIRVHAQLIRAATDDHFWSEEYDRELRDALALESDIAQSIAEKVEVTVTGEEHARLAAAHHVAPEVYESYLKGEDEFAKSNNRAGFEKSIAYFEEAINEDATFAPAYVGMASAYDRLGTNLVGASPDEVRSKVISAARKALELDPELAEPHDLLANVYERQWKWNQAEVEYKRALEMDPNDVGAHLALARWLLCHGRMDEALVWSERAGKLDPFGLPNVMHSWILFHARRYDEAIRELHNVRAAEPNLAVAHWYLGFALIANGQADKAVPSLEKAVALTRGSPVVMGVLVMAYAHTGRHAEALRVLEELKRRQQTAYVPAAAFVNAYLGLGNNEQAFVWLEKGYKEQSSVLGLLKVHPFFDPLRGDPRFKDLVHRVGLD